MNGRGLKTCQGRGLITTFMECDARERFRNVQQHATELLQSRKLEECYALLSEHLENPKDKHIDDSDLAEAYNTRGQVKYLWVDFNGAVEDYSVALRHNPEFAVAYYNRGQIHYRMGARALCVV